MRPKTTGYKLPPRMLMRTKKHKKTNTVWTSYYYNGRDENGNRKEYPLGSDLNEAKRKWADVSSGCKLIHLSD